MKSSEFEQLLGRVEGDSLDFKKELYHLNAEDRTTKKDAQEALAKDIACMWNTPRESSAYIVFGVVEDAGKPSEFPGVENHPDSANIQQVLESWLDPTPIFEYFPVEYNGLAFGVLKIPIHRDIGIAFPVRERSDKFQKHQIYFRKNSRNSLPSPNDQERIRNWFKSGDLTEQAPSAGPDTWGAILAATQDFSPNCRHLLLISRLHLTDAKQLENLSAIPWDLVIDFDNQTLSDGSLANARKAIESKRALHIVTRGERQELRPGYSTYWYLARGLQGRQDTLVSDQYRNWIVTYKKDLSQTIHKAANVLLPAPSIVFIIWDTDSADAAYLKTTLEEILASFGEGLEIVLVTPRDSSSLSRLEENYGAHYFVCPVEHILYGFGAKALLSRAGGNGQVSLPTSTGSPCVLEPGKHAWIREGMDVLGVEMGLKPNDEMDHAEDFLRGREIDWYGLNIRADIERDLQVSLLRAVRDALKKRRAMRLNVMHNAGAGGTTLARRIAWEVHNEHSAVLLQSTNYQETAERLSYIWSLTDQSSLLIVDGGVISEDESDALFNRLRADHTPVVMLQMNRQYGTPKQGSNRFFLDEKLSEPEQQRMVEALSRMRPARKVAIQNYAAGNEVVYHTPFFLSLVAFERDFAGFERYVDSRLDGLTPVQSRVILFLSIAHWYGQRSIEANAFRQLLGLPVARPVRMRESIPGAATELLIKDRENKWRTSHPLVAERCIKRILAGTGSDIRLWGQRLSIYMKEFIEFCRGDVPVITQEGLDLVYSTVVSREEMGSNLDLQSGGRSFSSRILEDVPTKEGRHEVLRHLTEVYPDEAHFWAHLGRYLSVAMGQYQAALNALDAALQLQPQSNTIHHMRGMALRQWVYTSIRDRSDIAEVIGLAVNASQSFEQARCIAPHDDHGYISHVQMIIKVIDYAAKVSGAQPIVTIASSKHEWLRESLGVAEELLEGVRRNHQGELTSSHEEQCRANLSTIYGDHSQALQKWDGLLTRGEVFAPPVRRQIMWTYLARHDRQWDKLPQKEIRRIVELLETNLEGESRATEDYKHWMQAVRVLDNPPPLDSIIEKVAYWKVNSDAVDAVCVFH